jgi:hypothetical protein
VQGPSLESLWQTTRQSRCIENAMKNGHYISSTWMEKALTPQRAGSMSKLA